MHENLVRIAEQFGIDAKKFTPMDGYIGGIWRVETAHQEYVLKVHPNTDQERELLLSEDNLMKHLIHEGFREVPSHLRTVTNGFLVADGKFCYRMLPFISGSFLAKTKQDPTLLKSFGRFLGKLSAALIKLPQSSVRYREFSWDLRHLPLLFEEVLHIEDPHDRALVSYFFLQYEEKVLPFQYKLRQAAIHNDANDWNVLCNRNVVTGIIDFGDHTYSWLINELAVALTYVVFEKKDPLSACVNVIKTYHHEVPLEKLELDLLYYLIAGRLSMSVCQSAKAKKLRPDSQYVTVSEQPAWDSLRKWIKINPLRAAQAFYEACGYSYINPAKNEEILERRRKYLPDTLSLSYNEPIEMYGSAFQYMYDTQGNTYLDAYNNIMLVGHSHPELIRPTQKILARINTNTRYLFSELGEYTERLIQKFPSPLEKLLLVNSGSAATDLALRIIRHHLPGKKILSLEEGYHGNTEAAVGISHYKFKKNAAFKHSDCLTLPFPIASRDRGTWNLNEVDDCIQKALKFIANHKGEIAAFIAEPIMGCGGQWPLPPGYLKAVYDAIRQQGGVVVSDEVQTGFGRMGQSFWGFQLHDVIPDLVILGKPMGNGHPIGGVVGTRELFDSFDNGPEFFSSFGGNPVSCTVGLAVLDIIENERLQDHARYTGDYLINKFRGLSEKFKYISDVRGSGMFIGVELRDNNGAPGTSLARHLMNELKKSFILVGTDGKYNHVVKIKPPLSFNSDNCDALCLEFSRIIENYATKS